MSTLAGLTALFTLLLGLSALVRGRVDRAFMLFTGTLALCVLGILFL